MQRNDQSLNRISKKLRLLAVLYCLNGVLLLAVATIPATFIQTGLTMTEGPEDITPSKYTKDERAAIFVAIGTTVTTALLAFITLSFIAATSLWHRRRYRFCRIVAGFNCLTIPFGTILGILTLCLLGKVETEALFTLKSERPKREADGSR